MSQFWHAHWAEDSFKPTKLQNWQVPRWHPEWPAKHCTTTKFVAHKNGRLFARSKDTENLWSDFKGTWELPLKIDRKTAEELSRSTEIKKTNWNVYKKNRERECMGKSKKTMDQIIFEKDDTPDKIKNAKQIEVDNKEENLKYGDSCFKDKCKIIASSKL